MALDLDDRLAEGDRLSEAATARRGRYRGVTVDPPLTIEVDRFRARFGAWYEPLTRS